MGKVSIIIPTYNRARYLAQAIESALAQDYPNLEVIVSDNASTDNTPEIVKQYVRNPRFRYFRNEKNLGMAGNWRRAVYEYATGDYVIILSDDDYFIDNSYISNAMKFFMIDKDVVLVFANFRILYEDEYKNKTFKDIKMNLPYIMNGNNLFFNYLFDIPSIPLVTTLFNKELAIKLNCFSKNILGLDQELFLKMILNKKVCFINKIVAIYRQHPNSTIISTKKEKIDLFLKNIGFILSPAQYAINLGFDIIQVEEWKKRMLKRYFNSLLNNIMICKNYNSIFFLFKYILRNYPYCLTIFFNPKNILKMCLSCNRNLYSSVRNIYWRLFKRELPPPII